MPSRIDDGIRRDIAWSWTLGKKMDVIAQEKQVSYGTVRNVVDELKTGKFPESATTYPT